MEVPGDGAPEGRSAGAARRARAALGGWMVEAVAWADEHRRHLLWGGILGISSGVALLLHVHGLPGYTRITSQAQLIERLLARQQRASAPWHPQHLRLPVLLVGAAVHSDGRLRVQVAHYPLLLRWAHWHAGKRPAQQLLPAGTPSSSSSSDASPARSEAAGAGKLRDGGGLLTCTVAGLQDVQPGVAGLLQQHLAQPWAAAAAGGGQAGRWPRVATLRVIAATTDASHGAAAEAAAAEEPGPRSSSSPAATAAQAHEGQGTQQQLGQQAAEPKAQPRREAWVELWAPTLPQRALAAAAAAAAGVGTAGAPLQQQQRPPARQRGSLLVRRCDVAEQLLRHGLARVAGAEDFEWLGVRASRARAYDRAAHRARRLSLGVHAPPGGGAGWGVGVKSALLSRGVMGLLARALAAVRQCLFGAK